MDIPQRFWDKVNKTATCWLWTAAKDKSGYGRFHWGKGSRAVLAHKFLWEMINGPVPKGMQLDHRVCDNPSCVNPSHLVACAPWENNKRGKSTSANNARKTHCIRGHELSGHNLMIISSTGHRRCRACVNERERRNRKSYPRGE